MTEQLANFPQSALNGPITAGASSLVLASAARFSASGNFRVLVDGELILVTIVAGNTFSGLQRGIEGTTATAHAGGATVTQILTAGALVAFVANPITASGRTAWTIASFFVDPANSSGLANDANDGLTVTTPILSTAEFNRRIFMRDVKVACTVKYMSDDAAGENLAIDSVAYHTAGSLKFVGTPQVVRSSTLTAQQSIAPATNTRQRVTDPVAGTWAASVGHYVESKTGGNLGNRAWVVSNTGAPANTANMSRVVTPYPALAAGAFGATDAYDLKRGSCLKLGVTGGQGGNTTPRQCLTFRDFRFLTQPGAQVAVNDNGCFVGFRDCYFEDIVVATTFTVNFDNCNLANGLFFAGLTSSVTLQAGVLNFGFVSGNLFVTGDTYVTNGPVVLNGSTQVTMYDAAFGGFGVGMQIQDVVSSVGALYVEAQNADIGGNPQFSVPASLWGSGNTGPGVGLGPGATLIVGGTSGKRPTLTGSAGDYAFIPLSGGALITTARPWNEAGGVAGASASCTWANLWNAGSLNYNAHCFSTNAAIIGV